MSRKDYLIAGSNALKYWIPEANIKPNDLDIFYSSDHKQPDEIRIDSNPALRIEGYVIPAYIYEGFDTKDNFLTLEHLYILKLSHASFDIHWVKTCQHIQIIKNSLSKKYHIETKDVFSKIIEEKLANLQQYNLLKDHWARKHKTNKNVNLNRSKDEFFNNNLVNRKYDHDFLHTLVSYYDEPLYKSCLKDSSDVMFDKKKFDNLTFADKLKLCREEIFTLALERILLPCNYEVNEHKAYRDTYRKLCTGMSKGWFSYFLADNYEYLYKFDINYLKLFLSRLKERRII